MSDQYPTDRESLERDCDVQFFIATGPGGQNRNKVETGVRLTHRPSGMVVTATERRSQHANREAAYARMAERLEEAQRVAKPRASSRVNRTDREKRLAAKRRASEIKRMRSTLPDE